MIYSLETFENFKQVGNLTSHCLDLLNEFVQEGVSTQDIDDFVGKFAIDNNLTCATLGYRGYPARCCTSVNHVACHGIPSPKKILKKGDIIKIDVTFIDKDGFYADSCRTYWVGSVSGKARLIIDAARTALLKGLSVVQPGTHIGFIGYAIKEYIEKETPFSVCKDFIGHGIGRQFHEPPDVPHYCHKEDIQKTEIMNPGLVFTIEPIIAVGNGKVKVLDDGWTAVTRDRSLAAQFEYTIGVTENGHEVFTK